ncbi:hypothetical protein ACNH6C_13790 [Bdellovibrio bacteriovorus]|uniref:hypothetical protein n=1 Tax=Bdellovibrio bacteriovorus TaxID=959 RepID=UPI003A7FC8F1
MKYIYLLLITFFAWSQFASAQSVAVLRTDKATYTSGESTLLFISLKPIQDSLDEYYITSTIGGSASRFIRFSDREFAAVVKNVAEGTHSWAAMIYKQNKFAAQGIQNQILTERNRLLELKRLKRFETDPAKIADLDIAIASAEANVVGFQNQLNSGRTLIETKTKDIVVSGVKMKNKGITDSMELSVLSANDTFEVGQTGQVRMILYPEHFGSTDEMEVDITASIGGQSVLAEEFDINLFRSLFSTTSLGVGTHLFEASLYLRDKNAANAVREAITLGGKRKVQLKRLKDDSLNSNFKLFYESEIGDVDAILGAFEVYLRDLKTFAVTKSVAVNIVNPPPVAVSTTQLELTEGQSYKSYSVQLNADPSGPGSLLVASSNVDVEFSLDTLNWTNSLTFNYDVGSVNSVFNVYVKVPNNNIIDGVRFESITHTLSGGYAGVIVPSVGLTLQDFVQPLVCDPVYNSIYGSWGSVSYWISLPHAPPSDVEVTISQGAGWEFSLNGGMDGASTTLYFNTYNWYQPQEVIVSVGGSGWMGSQIYTFTHSVFGDNTIGDCGAGVDYYPY